MNNQWQTELDFRLLRVLQLLLTHRSVSHVAGVLEHSQPSVSANLRKLREIFSDPLLVRSGARMVLTERGNDLVPVVEAMLETMRAVVRPEDFDPGASRRHLRVIAANCFNPFFLPALSQLIRERAPGMTVEYCAMRTDSELMQALEEGQIDLVIANWPTPPETLRYAPLMTTDIVCMVRPSHPLAHRPGLDMETYLTLSHLSPSPVAHALMSPIDGKLRALQLKRQIAVTVPEYTVAPLVLARTDLVFTTGRPFAEHLASSMSFRLLAAPPELGQMAFYMLWHERLQESGCNRWLRGLVREVAGGIESFGRDEARRTIGRRRSEAGRS
ncbi:MAG TPA: LysR family transcriptional regulator [Amaricoccus sp.]|nr:LysR family transcriptional regulator [Amaricoccus sp.]HRO10277.1 LysR family transcriptional regulator [Amaricoccus sp.]